MNTINDDNNNKTELANEALTIPCVILCAASTDSERTGACYMYKYRDEANDAWRIKELLSPYGNVGDLCILSGIHWAILALTRELEEQGNNAQLDIRCEIKSDTIIQGFNIHRPMWEAGGYLNKGGNKIKFSGTWKQFFELTDQHKVTIGKPKAYTNELKGCARRARVALSKAHEHASDEHSDFVFTNGKLLVCHPFLGNDSISRRKSS